MSAETSHITDISGGASGTAASPKKPAEKAPADKPQQAKRVGVAPAPSASGRPTSGESSVWPMPTMDFAKFFEESRERLREAFEQANGRFDTVRAAARDTGDMCQECQSAAITGFKDLNEHVFELVQGELDRGYDFLKAATGVKGVSDLIQLQADFVRESMEAQLDQGKTLAELTMNIFKSSFAPLQSGMANIVENARKRG